MRRTILLDGIWNFTRLWESTVHRDRIPVRRPRTRRIRVPANWWLEGEDFAGEALYERTFRAPVPRPGEGAWLEFGGADYFLSAELNGRPAGDHEGYFQTFAFDVTALLREENRLRVRVASPKENARIWPHRKILIKGIFNHHDTRPGSWDKERGQDRNTGGLWGSVRLHLVDRVFVKSVRLTPRRLPGGAWSVAARVVLWNAGEAGTFDLSLEFAGANFPGGREKPLGRRLMLPPGDTEIELARTFAKPRLWWTWDHGEPALYRCRTEVREVRGARRGGRLLDRREDRFGLRELQIEPGWRFILNGRRFFPRGTNIIPTQWLSEYGAREARRDVRLLREANGNALRVHAHVNRRELYDACDEAGILVWQDFALQWSYDQSDAFARNACRQIREMVRQLHNHASILVWCCHNEPSVNRKDLDPLLAAAVREEDASRPVDEASDFRFHPYPGWYWTDSKVKELPGHFREESLVSEFGAQALPDIRTLRRTMPRRALWPPDWRTWAYHDFQYAQTFDVAGIPVGRSLREFVANSQTYQARLLKDYVETLRLHKDAGVTGLFQFMFVDCWPSVTWSVVDYFRRPKRGYFALKRAFQPLLPVWRNTVPRRRAGDALNHSGPLLRDVAVVNDLPRAFRRLRLSLRVVDPRGRTVHREGGTFSVAADCVARPFDSGEHFGDTSKTWRLPKDAPPGVWRVLTRIIDAGGRTVAENAEEVLVARWERLPQGFGAGKL